MAAPVYASVGSVSAAQHTTTSIAVPSGVASGDVIVAMMYLNNTATVTPPAGFTEITPTPTTAGPTAQRCWWKRASGADTGTYAFTHASMWTEGVAIRVTGASASDPPVLLINQVSRDSSGTAAPAVSGSTTGADRLLVYGTTSGGGGGSSTFPSGFTERYDASGWIQLSTNTQTVQGSTGSLTSTASSSGPQTAAVYEVLPVGGTTWNGNANESATFTDSASVAFTRPLSPADTSTFTDTSTATHSLPAYGADTATFTDAVGTVSTNHITAADNSIFGDGVIATMIRADISEYNFVLDLGNTPWVPFGAGQAVNLTTFDPGGFTVRSQDVDSPVGDYVNFGTDFHTPPLWAWELWTDTTTPADGLAWAALLKTAWNNAVRKSPSGVVPCRYKVGGRVRRVYGRPRRLTPTVADIQTGKVRLVADFQLAEDTYYDDGENSVTVGMTPQTIQGSGVILPAVVPWVFTSTPAPRTSSMIIGGEKETWVDVIFHGPSDNPWVSVGGLTWGLTGHIIAGQWVRLSGKPWQMGVYRVDGSYSPAQLDPRARLSQLQFKPGTYPVIYGAYDNTGSSTADLRWYNANESI